MINAHPIPFDTSEKFDLSNGSFDAFTQCHWMLEQIEKFVQDDQLEKAFRWLGFVQGCLWSFGVFSIDNLRDDNRGTGVIKDV